MFGIGRTITIVFGALVLSILALSTFVVYKIYEPKILSSINNIQLSISDQVILTVTILILVIFVYSWIRITSSPYFKMVTKL